MYLYSHDNPSAVRDEITHDSTMLPNTYIYFIFIIVGISY